MRNVGGSSGQRRSRISAGLAGLFTLWILCGAAAQSSLPPQVQADLVKQQIVDALKKEDVKTALAAFDKYHELKVKMPPPMMFLEAKAASAAGDALRAFKSLEAFLKTSPKEGKQYRQALALYPQYEEAAKPALEEEARSRFGQFTLVDIDPPSAKVILPDIEPSYSPGMTLPVGEVNVRLTAPGYETFDGSCDVTPGNNRCGPIKLEADPSIMQVYENNTDVLYQPATKRFWLRRAPENPVGTYEGAAAACRSIGTPGEWRIATRSELNSIGTPQRLGTCGSHACAVSPLFRINADWIHSKPPSDNAQYGESTSFDKEYSDAHEPTINENIVGLCVFVGS